MKNILLIFCLIFLCGCAVATKPYYSSVPAFSDKGIVLVSFSHPQFSYLHWNYKPVNDLGSVFNPTYLYVRSKQHGESKFQKFAASQTGNDFELIYHEGRTLYPFMLAAGEYEFYSWGQSTANSHRTRSAPFSIQFRVDPGKVTYIGSIEMKLETRNRYNLKIKDRALEDIGIYRRQVKNISYGDIRKSIAKKH